MFNNNYKEWAMKGLHLTAACAIAMSLSACSSTMDRLNRIGQPPELSTIKNPQLAPDYREVSVPLPDPTVDVKQANSLWDSQRQSFFKDQRASQEGDILTVVINIADEASLENSSERSRQSAEDLDLPGLLGLETQLTKVLPEGTTPNDLVNIGSTTDLSSEGTIEREEEIDLKIAAMVTQVLPNGNMVIHGRQEVRVNHEVRDLELAGIIRPADIGKTNVIPYEKIAEARISYGGRGYISDVQKPRYGNEVLDILMPF